MVTALPTRARAGLALASLALVAGGLTGCSATNPITTAYDYEPSDGSGLQLEDVRAGNLLVLTSEEGAEGVLLGYVANTGSADTSVTFTVEGGEESSPVRVRAGETALLGPEGESVEVASAPAPGTFVELTMHSDAGGSSTVQVPVFDDTHSEYADLVP